MHYFIIEHALANLFKIKTIVTLAIVFVFCFQAIRGAEISDGFLILAATAVVNYYFTRSEAEKETDIRKDDEK